MDRSTAGAELIIVAHKPAMPEAVELRSAEGEATVIPASSSSPLKPLPAATLRVSTGIPSSAASAVAKPGTATAAPVSTARSTSAPATACVRWNSSEARMSPASRRLPWMRIARVSATMSGSPSISARAVSKPTWRSHRRAWATVSERRSASSMPRPSRPAPVTRVKVQTPSTTTARFAHAADREVEAESVLRRPPDADHR